MGTATTLHPKGLQFRQSCVHSNKDYIIIIIIIIIIITTNIIIIIVIIIIIMIIIIASTCEQWEKGSFLRKSYITVSIIGNRTSIDCISLKKPTKKVLPLPKWPPKFWVFRSMFFPFFEFPLWRWSSKSLATVTP